MRPYKINIYFLCRQKMSTPNFPVPVIGTYYAIGMDTYDRDEIKKDMEMQEEKPNDLYEKDVDDYIQMAIEDDIRYAID
jgi:hypothetical protein